MASRGLVGKRRYSECRVSRLILLCRLPPPHKCSGYTPPSRRRSSMMEQHTPILLESQETILRATLAIGMVHCLAASLFLIMGAILLSNGLRLIQSPN